MQMLIFEEEPSDPEIQIVIRTYHFSLKSLSSSRPSSAFAKDANAVMTSGIPTRVQAFINTSRKRFDTFSCCSLSLGSISMWICEDNVPILSGFPHATSAEAYRSCKRTSREGACDVVAHRNKVPSIGSQGSRNLVPNRGEDCPGGCHSVG